MNSNFWIKTTVFSKNMFVRMNGDTRFGIVRFIPEKGLYSATFTEYIDDVVVDTTKQFKSLFEALLWVDCTLNFFYGLEYPDEYPKGLSKDFY